MDVCHTQLRHCIQAAFTKDLMANLLLLTCEAGFFFLWLCVHMYDLEVEYTHVHKGAY